VELLDNSKSGLGCRKDTVQPNDARCEGMLIVADTFLSSESASSTRISPITTFDPVFPKNPDLSRTTDLLKSSANETSYIVSPGPRNGESDIELQEITFVTSLLRDIKRLPWPKGRLESDAKILMKLEVNLEIQRGPSSPRPGYSKSKSLKIEGFWLGLFSVTLYDRIIDVSLGPPLIVLEAGVASFTETVTLMMDSNPKFEDDDKDTKTDGRKEMMLGMDELKINMFPPEAVRGENVNDVEPSLSIAALEPMVHPKKGHDIFKTQFDMDSKTMESDTRMVPRGRGVCSGGNAKSNSSVEPVTTGGSFGTQNTKSIFDTASARQASDESESLAKLKIRMKTVASPYLLSQAN
jgi:hypothetical protein